MRLDKKIVTFKYLRTQDSTMSLTRKRSNIKCMMSQNYYILLFEDTIYNVNSITYDLSVGLFT